MQEKGGEELLDLGAPGFPGKRKIPETERGFVIPCLGFLRDQQGVKESGVGRRIPPWKLLINPRGTKEPFPHSWWMEVRVEQGKLSFSPKKNHQESEFLGRKRRNPAWGSDGTEGTLRIPRKIWE